MSGRAAGPYYSLPAQPPCCTSARNLKRTFEEEEALRTAPVGSRIETRSAGWRTHKIELKQPSPGLARSTAISQVSPLHKLQRTAIVARTIRRDAKGRRRATCRPAQRLPQNI